MTLRNVSILFLAGLLAGLLGGALPAPGARALVPPEPGAQAGAPVESWLVSLQGPSVYRRLMADAEGAALVAAQVPADIAPLARRLEAEVLDGQRDSIRAAEGLGIRVISRYSASGNGLLVHATSAQAAALLGQPGVIRVEPALMVRPQLTMSRPHIGATRLASELGYDGSGSYVAVIDTGVDYTHAHLGGPGDPAVWTAATAAGATEVITDTYLGERIFPNDKVVAGWDFVGRRYNPPHICSDADMAAGTCTNIPEPDPDPIDGGNHGTHVSGIVAGEAIDGIGDGIAPGAKIVGLKLYGRGGADEAIDLLADAIDYCTRVNLGIEDRGVTPPRVDAINTSLGEVWAQGSRLFDEIVEAAVGSGIAIASSAGNSGDVPFVQNAPPASPKMMSIASSVPPSESKVLEVVARWEDQEARYDGIDSSLVSFADKGAVEGDLAWYGQACNDGDGNPTPPVQEQSEKVSLIARGTCTFSEKLLNAQAAGAIAVVMYTDNRAKNAMGGGADGIDIPSLMIDNADGRALQTLLEAGTAVSVSIDPAKIRTVPLPGDAVSGFSSRGPSKNGALKPDITAPGSEIVSALAGSGTGGAAFSGTSMASPMVAGAAAVIQQRNRDEGLGLDGLGISQLLMNYARPVIYAGSPDNRMPVVRQGAGLVDLWGAGTGRL
ncbi:MAG: S8 family serine peptidase, partial [Chloroflexi bacterium]|nr:S8 family serine peptidase [Chloroflexota bacterium]